MAASADVTDVPPTITASIFQQVLEPGAVVVGAQGVVAGRACCACSLT